MNRKCPIFLSVLFLAVIYNVYGQVGPVAKTANSVGLISFEIRGNPEHKSFGTGTLIAKPYPGGSLKIFLVTNGHVLPVMGENDSIQFSIRSSSKEVGYFKFSIPIYSEGKLDAIVKFDPDGNDLAVIDVTKLFVLNSRDLDFLVGNMFTTSFLAEKDSLARYNVEIGDEIIFIGYPSLFFEQRYLSPVVRTGVIASFPNEDYHFSSEYRTQVFLRSKQFIPHKINGFLVDGNVFGGSSGSLVFTKPRMFRLEEGRLQYNIDLDNSVVVLGILTTSYFDLGSPSALGERVHLGGVIFANQIRKTIDLFK
jgi:hypothetical protein